MTKHVMVVAAIAAALTAPVASHEAASRQDPAPAPAAGREAAVSAQERQASPPSPEQQLINRYCVGCHNQRTRSGNLVLAGLDVTSPGDHAEIWERVVRKLRNGLMPPAGAPRPDDATYDRLLATLQERLDGAAAANPNPGRTETAHRLNRLEYRNAIRDLLDLDVNIEDLLPADDSSYGFDNIAGVLKTSPSLMERYLAAARVISRVAVGSPPPALDTAIYRVPAEVQQHDRQANLPFGTRGGTLITHTFPLSGEYDIKVGLTGLGSASELLEIAIDGVQVAFVTPEPRSSPEIRVPVTAGPHDVVVTFFRNPLDLVEQVREPFQNPDAPSNTGGPVGRVAAVTSVTISGPHAASGPGDTPSRQRIFVCTPSGPAEEGPCARTILSALARRAYRGLVTPESLEDLYAFYEEGRARNGRFEEGIELALRRLLVSPEFLYRIEADPPADAARGEAAGGIYRISDLELASRLSFFLWSSIPDEELLDLAEQGRLSDSAVLERQVARMLADPRSETLTTSFASQWLAVRNLDTARPGEIYALEFDETLRRSMRRETELFVDSIFRENRGVLELLTADYTFVNERLAVHYGIPGIQGSHFRRITLPADSPRRGLLGHGSILTVTSPAIRTSPVIRGKWILNNILGAPPPDPPPNVPALSERRTQAKVQSMRERMAQHRANAACAACHNMIDPAGFALENFDAIGRWREVDESFNPIDASGTLPDGSKFNGVTELRAALARRPERFVHTVAEKLMTYALGRGLEYYDMPAVRRVLRDAAPEYRMHDIVQGIVRSAPFQYRRREAAGPLQARAPAD